MVLRNVQVCAALKLVAGLGYTHNSESGWESSRSMPGISYPLTGKWAEKAEDWGIPKAFTSQHR